MSLLAGIIAGSRSLGGFTLGDPWILTAGASVTRNDYAGWVGGRFTVGASGININALGRMIIAGNSQTHTLKITTTGGSVVATAALNTSGLTVGQYGTVALASPVALAASTTYIIQSEEFLSGDLWREFATITTDAKASSINAAYGSGSYANLTNGAANNTYVLVNMYISP